MIITTSCSHTIIRLPTTNMHNGASHTTRKKNQKKHWCKALLMMPQGIKSKSIKNRTLHIFSYVINN
jgi:hypothetical protein